METDNPRLLEVNIERIPKGNKNMNKLPNESGVFDDDCLEWDDKAEVEEQDGISNIIQESIKMEPDEISNDKETRTGGTVEQISELSNDEILSFLELMI